MDDSKWERWGALGGIVFAVLVTVSALLPGSPPKTSDSAAKIVKFFADNGDEIRWAAYIGGLATLALFWWLGSVWRLMRRAEGGVPRLAVVAIAGAVFASATAAIGGVLLAVVPIVGVGTVGGPGPARFFYVLSTNVGTATEIGIAALIGSFSAVIIRSRVLPSVLGWLGALDRAHRAWWAQASWRRPTTRSLRSRSWGSAAAGLWVLIVSIFMLRAATGARRGRRDRGRRDVNGVDDARRACPGRETARVALRCAR